MARHRGKRDGEEVGPHDQPDQPEGAAPGQGVREVPAGDTVSGGGEGRPGGGDEGAGGDGEPGEGAGLAERLRGDYAATSSGDPAAAEPFLGEGDRDKPEPPAVGAPGDDGGDDPRSARDKAAGGSSRGLVEIEGQEFDVIRQVARTSFTDTAHLSGQDREGAGRTLRVAGEIGDNDPGEEAGTAAAPSIPPEHERATLTIDNTMPGTEPGREMRDTTGESADKGLGPTGSSAPDAATDPEAAAAPQPDAGHFRTRDTAAAGVPSKAGRSDQPGRIKHHEVALEMLRAGMEAMRRGGRGDDFTYLRAALRLAEGQLPLQWRRLAGKEQAAPADER